MNAFHVLHREADHLLRARHALTNSGVKIADTFLIHPENGKLLASGGLPLEITHGLDRFAESPLLIRSDTTETILCPNRNRQETIAALRMLVRNSAEQIALMIVKIPGTRHGRHFYPHISGIASSFNPFAWNEYIDPRAGVVRLVFGLGTRFNDRSGDDFSRVVALNAPYRRPETDFEEICNYSQRKMDYIDLDNHRLESGYFVDIAKDATDIPVRLFITEGASSHPIMGTRPVALTFDIVLAETEFISTLRWILGALENSFGRVVEIEFGADFTQDRKFTITITSCRTLPEAPPAQINPQHIVLNAQGAVVGQSRTLSLDHIVYVTPHYGQLPLRERYEIARLVGRISKALAGRSLLLGPGRWCTTSPELGIPASFAEINRVSAICEIVAMRDNLVPDVSMGAHIFNELVATGMLYFALFPSRKGNIVNYDFLDKTPNRLTTLAPEASSWNPVLKVIELKRAILRADVLKQEVTVVTPS